MLQVRGLTKRYRQVTAVDSLSFELREGEIVALLGPNGAGKSTTFLCMAGLVRPDAGSFAWDGRELGIRRSRMTALIPETPDLYSDLTVWEHLVFAARSCKIPEGWEARAEDLLARLNLETQRDVLGASLSKGMRQKTLIATMLIADAPVLLIDEPMIGLDPAGQRELRELLRELRASGKAIMVSTHMLDVAQAIGDRVIILKEGRSCFEAPIEALNAGTESLESIFLRITA
jgi:ABC-2 type transport system ATP-binding protein